YCGCSQHDSLDARVQQRLESRHVANSTSNLDLGACHGGGHLAQDVQVLRHAFEGPIKIHDVQPLGAFTNPFGGHLERIAVDRNCVLTALFEPHGLPAKDVDCRIDLHNCAKL